MTAIAEPVLLTVRGTTKNPSLDANRELHNRTAGSPEGIAAARSLGDLSHKVYVPAVEAGGLSSARAGELLFLDQWVDADGIQRFFANAHVQEQGGALFGEREGAVWMAARGGFAYHLPTPTGREARFVGMLRARVTSPEAAIEAFNAMTASAIRDARRRGQVSHRVLVKLGAPSDPVEILGLDTWMDLAGLVEHYRDEKAMGHGGLAGALAGPPTATVWQQAEGGWSEW